MANLLDGKSKKQVLLPLFLTIFAMELDKPLNHGK